MVTYIKNDVPQNHIELEHALNPKYYDNIGRNLEDYKNGKWVLLTKSQTKFLKEHPNASMEEVYNMKLVVFEPTLEDVKKKTIDNILLYDSSDSVNTFIMNHKCIWLDKATRSGLKLRFEAELKAGNTDTVLWYDGNPYPIKLESAIELLYLVELYASKCYDVTQQHIYNINQMTSIEDVQAYNYIEGYPEILKF